MTRWTFFGRILPERIPLSITLPEQRVEIAAFGLRYRATIQIDKGQFVIPAIIESGQIDVFTLRNAVEDLIRSVTDLIGYLDGSSFDIDTISALSDEGPTVIFGIGIPVLQQAREAQIATIESDLLKAVSEEIPARLVLADFREAIRNPVGMGFFCYRAIEAMMQSMKALPDDKDGPAWDTLRSRLQLTRPVIDTIKGHADYPRHGKVSSIGDADRATVFWLTDQIVKRYLAYLRGGKVPLTSSEFPPLINQYISRATFRRRI
jgi:hypothetical protein